MQIFFNPSPMEEKLLTYPLDKIKCFILNQHEGKNLTGEHKPQDILNKMLNLYPDSSIILTMGADGVIYQDKNNIYHQPAYKTKVVDTTAAGDTLLGYYIASIQKNMTIPAALDLAAKASAITVSKAGAAESIPYLKEVC
jgi:ribokinase